MAQEYIPIVKLAEGAEWVAKDPDVDPRIYVRSLVRVWIPSESRWFELRKDQKERLIEMVDRLVVWRDFFLETYGITPFSD